MGKFWTVLFCFGLCLLTAILATQIFEEYRWQKRARTLEDLLENLEETHKSTTGLIKILEDFGEKQKAEETRAKQEDMKTMKNIAHAIAEKTLSRDERILGVIPGLSSFIEHEKKTNVRNAAFALLSVSFVVFVIVAGVKTQRRLSAEAQQLAKDRVALTQQQREFNAKQDRLNQDRELIKAQEEDLRLRKTAVDEIFNSLERPTEATRPERDAPRPPVVAEELPTKPLSVSWKLVSVSSPKDEGEELPQDLAQRLKRIETFLRKLNCSGLTADQVEKQIEVVIGMTIQQRQRMKEVKSKTFAGWKCARVRMYRIFFHFDETNNVIRLSVRQRKTAYL